MYYASVLYNVNVQLSLEHFQRDVDIMKLLSAFLNVLQSCDHKVPEEIYNHIVFSPIERGNTKLTLLITSQERRKLKIAIIS